MKYFLGYQLIPWQKAPKDRTMGSSAVEASGDSGRNPQLLAGVMKLAGKSTEPPLSASDSCMCTRQGSDRLSGPELFDRIRVGHNA